MGEITERQKSEKLADRYSLSALKSLRDAAYSRIAWARAHGRTNVRASEAYRTLSDAVAMVQA